jgi:hypothetical protein
MTPHDAAQQLARLAADHATRLKVMAGAADTIKDQAHLVAALLRTATPPVLTGPPWPVGSTILGRAKPSWSNDTASIMLRPTTGDPASSDMHEVHTVLAEPLTSWRLAVDLLLNAGALRARTWKWGGMVAFDGDWKRWPGGHTSANAGPNSMVRITGDHYARDGRPRFGVYATFGTPMAGASTDVSARVGGQVAWVSNKGHTCHWLLPDIIAPDRWYRVELDVNPTSLTASVDGNDRLVLTGLPWPTVGFNRLYVSTMLGGSGPDFLPDTPDRSGLISYRRAELRQFDAA